MRDITAQFPTEAISGYDIGLILSVEPLSTSGNLAWRITSEKGRYLLRLSPGEEPRWRSEGEIKSELELMDHLLAHDFTVPRPIKNATGQALISFNNRNGYLREYSNGKHKENPTPREIEKFGELLGQLHSLIENFKTKHERDHAWDLASTKKHFLESKPEILTGQFAEKEDFVRLYEKEISSLNFPDDLPSGMIHEDLGKRHVLWDNDQIVAVIDFDRTYYGKIVLDLGQACRGWCFVDDWKSWSDENFSSLIKGYETRRRLTEPEKEYLLDAIKFAILERALSFCLRSIQNGNSNDVNFAWRALEKNGLLDILNNNQAAIKATFAKN